MTEKLQKLRELLKVNKIDALIVSTPANITYLVNFDFLSPGEREAFLVITQKHQYVISSFLYKEELILAAPEFTFLDIGAHNGTPFWEYLKQLAEKEHLQRIGFEERNLTVAEYMKVKKQKITLVPLVIDGIRAVKTKAEITAIQHACEIGDAAFAEILLHIKPGMTEKEVGLLLDTAMRKKGAEPSFTTIIAFGKNAAIPHHHSDETVLQKQDSILMDFGAKVDNYCSDMTRTVFVGQPSPHQEKMYQTVKGAQQKALDFLFSSKTPISAEEVDKKAREYIVQKGYPSIPHSLGHSIGIAVHDGFGLSPYSPTKLIEGMVFSIEPGIYLSGDAGVRIEDLVALTENGPEILTKSTRDLIVL